MQPVLKQPKKPKTDKQVVDGLGADFEEVMKALINPIPNPKK